MIDFKQDLKCTTLRLLNYYGVRYKDKDDLFHLLIKLHTFGEKYIHPHKRVVCYSSELFSQLNMLPLNVREALVKMEEWITKGEDINPFQGRGLYGEGSRDYQNALYGIVHLHLSAKATDSTPIIKERFAKRSDYLLFALFRKDIAFFINVVRHPQTLSKNNPRVSEWTSAELLKIIENNWPDILEKSRIQGVSLCDNEGNKIALTDEDVAELTVNGISTFIQGKQGLYMPRLGISSSGDNVNAVCTAQREIRNAEICQEHFLKHQYEIRTTFIKYLRKAGISLPDVFDFHYDHISALGKYFIVDRHTCAAYDVFSGDLYTYSPLPTLVLHKKRMGIEINSMPIGQRLSITSP